MRCDTMRSSILFFFLAVLMPAAGGTSNAQELEVMVREKATIQGDTIHLGDIASFDPGSDVRVAELGKIEVATAPCPGSALKLNSRLLLHKLGNVFAGMDNVRIRIPDTLIVQRTAQTVSEEKLRRIFRDHVTAHAPWPAEKLKFEKINIPGAVLLPEGILHWEIKNRGASDFVGDVSLVVGFLVDGHLVRKVPLSGKVTLELQVVKAARNIKLGEIIEEDDLISSVERNMQVGGELISHVDEAAGRKAVRYLHAGQLITRHMIEEPPAVMKGDQVIIKAENQRIEITARGRVLEDGRSGEQVRVVNAASGKEVFATVTGPGQVEVSF